MLRPYLVRRAKETETALPLKMWDTSINKVQKIYNAEPMVKTRAFFPNHLSTEYFTQWDEFPHGTHDDGPDATVSCMLALDRMRRHFVV